MTAESPVPPARVVGAVLCGGRSRRLGRDKALVEVGGVPLALRVAGAMRTAGVDPVVAVGGTAGGVLGLPTVADRHPDSGPLAALATALWWARTGLVVVAACDLALLTGDHVAALVAAADAGTAAVAEIDGVVEPSLGCWPAGARSAVAGAVGRGHRAWRDALTVVAHRTVTLPAEAGVDVDTEDAVGEVRRRLGSRDPDPTNEPTTPPSS
ncbi:MAG: molybdenum cofactor guanylyltransferase [Acidimicrobiales bacterium]